MSGKNPTELTLRTIGAADMLYGVTMQERGISIQRQRRCQFDHTNQHQWCNLTRCPCNRQDHTSHDTG